MNRRNSMFGNPDAIADAMGFLPDDDGIEDVEAAARIGMKVLGGETNFSASERKAAKEHLAHCAGCESDGSCPLQDLLEQVPQPQSVADPEGLRTAVVEAMKDPEFQRELGHSIIAAIIAVEHSRENAWYAPVWKYLRPLFASAASVLGFIISAVLAMVKAPIGFVLGIINGFKPTKVGKKIMFALDSPVSVYGLAAVAGMVVAAWVKTINPARSRIGRYVSYRWYDLREGFGVGWRDRDAENQPYRLNRNLWEIGEWLGYNIGRFLYKRGKFVEDAEVAYTTGACGCGGS